MAKLGDYRRKRRPSATNEPFGEDDDAIAPDGARQESAPATARPAASDLRGAYVVHLHDATRRHYDVRIEVGGVLWSFAVPHGPSLDPDDKHLAVKTEDHPIEYLEFEDVIPDAQYGAGPMIAWDRGVAEFLEGPPDEELARGKLHVRLRGMKLRGAWAFVKLGKGDRSRPAAARGNKGNEWLFFKKSDEHASKERSITDEIPRSVLSGLTVEELARANEIGEARVAEALARGAARPSSDGARPPPADARPIEAASGEPASGGSLVYDAELDGLRVVASREGDVVAIRLAGAGSSGPGEALEAFYPETVRALRSLPTSRLVLDGTLVVFDETGHPSLALLAARAARFGDRTQAGLRPEIETPAVLVATDVLAVGDADTRPMSLEARRELLSSLLPDLGFVRAAPPLEGPRAAILELCASHGVAAVVAKPKGAPYDPAKAGWVRLPTGIAPRSRPAVTHGHASPSSARGSARTVVVSNRAKVFWPPPDGYTKGDLVDFYTTIADAILPHVVNRPVILVRYPDGIAGKSFYQWNVPPGMPPWVRTMSFDEGGEHRRGFLIDDPSTLTYLANLACIPLHILACRAPAFDEADFLTIDFDVKQSELRHAITLARELRDLLDAIGLPGYPKTSGQSGLHVLVPLGEGQSFETARALADLLGQLLVDRHPAIATMERVIARRGPRVYVDTGQTGATRAIVAPYSVRAVPGATVSTPLTWDEVTSTLDPRAFTIKTLPRRLAARGDLMAPMLSAAPDVPRAVEHLASLVSRRRP